MLYLRGCLLTVEAQDVIHKSVPELVPVDVRISYVMCIEITCSPSELGGDRYLFELSRLGLQSFYKYFDFFPEPGRRGRLTMGSCQHRNVLPLHALVNKGIGDLLKQWEVYIFQSFFIG